MRIFVFTLILQLGADINYAGGQGITPLMWTCIRDHRALVKEFITLGANYHLESKDSNKLLRKNNKKYKISKSCTH